jgi:2-deoxy-D-gluconate 3-dehydrogenase
MNLEAFSLKGRNALVTGSRIGLGKAIAHGLAAAGANIVIHGSRADSLEEASKEAACHCVKAPWFTADLAQPDACADLIDFTVRELGSIDILVNNAGIIRRAPAVEYSAQDWDEVLNVDLSAVFRLSQLAGRHMLAQGCGKIVNIASMLSFQGGVFVPAYAAAKGAVAQLTKALANEWASKGVNVNAIAPGYFETENTEALRSDPVRNRQILDRIPAGRWGAPCDLAGAAVFLASRASDYVHGAILVVDGGWLAR